MTEVAEPPGTPDPEERPGLWVGVERRPEPAHRRVRNPELMKLDMLRSWATDLVVVGVMAVGNQYFNQLVESFAAHGLRELDVQAVRVVTTVGTIASAGVMLVWDVWRFIVKADWGRGA